MKFEAGIRSEKKADLKKASERHHAIDWVKSIATLGVFLFHSGAAYAEGNWHINNTQKDFAITVWNAWLLLWIMPVFFFLSGASARFALRNRLISKFIMDRLQRLAVPLIFGIFVVVPPQVYIERLSRLQFTKSFIEFYPHYFNGWYLSIGGQGNFAWMGLHLWYLLLLLALSMTLIPILQWIERRNFFQGRFIRYANKPGVLLLFAVPIAIIEMTWGNLGLGGWNMATYPLFFLYGYLIFSQSNAGEFIKRRTFPALIGAIAISLTLLISLFADGPIAYGMYETKAQTVLHAFSGWFWIISILGLAYRYLNFHNSLLKYANEAVLPFYILHQTVIVILGYSINLLNMTAGRKYALVILTSFVSILALYELVKRVGVLRIAFGMKATPMR